MFIGGVDETAIDRNTERWLDGIEDNLSYDRWYCGHWHTDKVFAGMRFVFGDFLELK
jgi:3-oxoacid CoA-transferase subunit A